jgi:hypothetical protein
LTIRSTALRLAKGILLLSILALLGAVLSLALLPLTLLIWPTLLLVVLTLLLAILAGLAELLLRATVLPLPGLPSLVPLALLPLLPALAISIILAGLSAKGALALPHLRRQRLLAGRQPHRYLHFATAADDGKFRGLAGFALLNDGDQLPGRAYALAIDFQNRIARTDIGLRGGTVWRHPKDADAHPATLDDRHANGRFTIRGGCCILLAALLSLLSAGLGVVAPPGRLIV